MSYDADIVNQLYAARRSFEQANRRAPTHLVVNHWTERELLRSLDVPMLHSFHHRGEIMGLTLAIKPYDREEKLDMVVL